VLCEERSLCAFSDVSFFPIPIQDVESGLDPLQGLRVGGSRNVRTAQDPLSHYFRLLANFFLDNLRVLYFIQAAPLHEQSGATFWGMASILPTMETPLDLGKTKVASCQGRVESTGEKLPRGILDTRYTCGNAVAVPVMSIIHVDCISHLRY